MTEFDCARRRRRRPGRSAMGSRRRERARERARRLSGLCALPFSGRTLSLSAPRAEWRNRCRASGGPAVGLLCDGSVCAGRGRRRGRSATGSPRRERAQESARSGHRRVRAPTFAPDFIHWIEAARRRRLGQKEQPPARRAVAAWPPSYGVASARAGSRARA